LKNSNLISIGWVLLWSVSISISLAVNKVLGQSMNTVMIVFSRIVFGLIFFAPFLLRAKAKDFKTQKVPLHILRVLFTCGSMLCTYYAYAKLEIAFATSIGFTAPLITTIFSIIFLKEKVHWDKWLVIFLGFCGVLVIAHPTNFPFNAAVLVALGANLFASSALIALKTLTRTESVLTIMLYLNVLSFFMIGSFATGVFELPTSHELLLLGVLGAFASFSQFCYTQALKNGNPSVVAPFEYSRLVFAIPIGYLLFSELPTTQTLIGSFIIIASNLMLTFREARRSRSLGDSPVHKR
jgi:drug/metabolite transporter (DMT)-like permease